MNRFYKITEIGIIALTLCLSLNSKAQNITDNIKIVKNSVIPDSCKQNFDMQDVSVYKFEAEQFNKGFITSPYELIMGKIPGLIISSNRGVPGGDFTVNNHGGVSFYQSSTTLIIVDDIPLYITPLYINPNDIESITYLKDYSSAGVYQENTTTGAIVINTKKGGKKFKINYKGKLAVSYLSKKIDILSADEYRNAFLQHFSEQINQDPSFLDLLGDSKTDWQDEIYQTALSHDHFLNLSGSINKINLPYYISVGKTMLEGIVKTSKYDRTTANIALSPSYFKDHLKISLNLTGVFNKKNNVNKRVLVSAVHFDPTLPINYSESTSIIFNPVRLLDEYNETNKTEFFNGNIKVDYKFHFLPDLNVVLNYSRNKYILKNKCSEVPDSAWFTLFENNTTKKNECLDTYLKYSKYIDLFKSSLNIKIGISQRDYEIEEVFTNEFFGYIQAEKKPFRSYYASFNYSFKDKYLINFNIIRRSFPELSSKNKWTVSPSISLAWKIKNESFLINSNTISDLKLRFGYWKKTPLPDLNTILAEKTFANPNLTNEKYTSYNIGLEFGLFGNKINGYIEYFKKIGNDLILNIPLPRTSGSVYMPENIAEINTNEINFSINAKLINTDIIKWNIYGNLSYSNNEIKNLTGEGINDLSNFSFLTGQSSDGVGGLGVLTYKVGYPINSFYVYKQIYDNNGNPIEGMYEDLNNDGEINQDDKYCYKKASPDIIIGIASDLNYKNWMLSFSGRLYLGNYNYNNINPINSYRYLIVCNLTRLNYNAGFENIQIYSDYFIEKASFFRMDNICLSYKFENLLKNKLGVELYCSVQNTFVLTKYSQQDPETITGIDRLIYPRPRTFTFGLNISF